MKPPRITYLERMIPLTLAATPNQTAAQLQASTGTSTRRYLMLYIRILELSGRITSSPDASGITTYAAVTQ
jgi:hypothetical protein